MDDLRNDIHRVNNALIHIAKSATTWHQISEWADAALHVHLHYGIMQRQRDRDMQEQGGSTQRQEQERP